MGTESGEWHSLYKSLTWLLGELGAGVTSEGPPAWGKEPGLHSPAVRSPGMGRKTRCFTPQRQFQREPLALVSPAVRP